MLRSHIDLCFLIRVIDVPATMISSSLRTRLKAVQYNKLSSATWSEEALGSDSKKILNIELMFHESYHYWQGVSYPYLVWYSFLAFMEVVDSFRRLNKDDPIDVQSVVTTGLDRLNREYRCVQLNDQTVALAFPGSQPLESIYLTELDLIESATSVAQWRMYAADHERHYIAFSRWAKRSASYTKAFAWSSKLFRNKDLFLASYPFLVAAAFGSTQPVRTFLSYTSRLAEIEYLLIKEFDMDRPFDWPDIFDAFADVEEFDQTSNRMHLLCELNTSAYLPIALDEAVTFKWSGKLRHPISGIDVGRWAARVEADPSFRLVLGYPDIVRPFTMECIETFQPPLTLYRYDLTGRTLVVPSGDLNRIGLHEFAGPSTGAILTDFLTMYSAGRRLSGAHFDKDFRLCGHSACPRYETNLCNTWIYVPEYFEDCTFGDRLDYVRSVYLKDS